MPKNQEDKFIWSKGQVKFIPPEKNKPENNEGKNKPKKGQS